MARNDSRYMTPHGSALAGGRRRGDRATMADVARLAGVAPITVSRALREPETVSPELRTRVEQAVAALGYVPNRMARSLASSSTGTIGVVVPNLSNAVYADVIQGVHDVLSANGFQVFLGNSSFLPEREETFLATVLGWPPEGIIVTGVNHTDRTVAMLKQSGLPVVETMELTDTPIDCNVGYSHRLVGRDVAHYLVGRGYRKIGFVGAAMDHDYRGRRRWEGFREALIELGVAEPVSFIYDEIASHPLGAQALHDIRESGHDLDAVFFVNDTLAVGAILAAGDVGVTIPDELAIFGFNGLPIGEMVRPRLSTVLSPRYDIGRHAAELLVAHLRDHDTETKRIEVPYQLCPRESA